MKRLLLVAVTSVLLMFAVPMLFGYVSSPVVQSKPDREYSGGLAGDTITKGNVVSIDYSFNQEMTGTYDTGAWVVRSSAENDSFVVGVATQDAVPGQTVRWQAHGPMYAKIDGSDSLAGAAAITAGTLLSAADRDGFLGTATWDSNTASCGQAQNDVIRCNPIGYYMDAPCAITDTGALTTYLIFVNVR